MDIKAVARYCAYLAFSFLLVIVAVPARAQSGVCPDWTTAVQPSPGGSSPASLLFCSSESEDVIPIHNDSIPCGDGILFRSDWPLLPDHDDITIVPPLAQPFPSGKAQIQFALTVDYAIPFTPAQPIPRIIISSYGTNHVLLGQKTTDLFYAIVSKESDLITFYYSDFALSAMSSLNPTGHVDYLNMVQGGYIRVVVDQPPAYQLNRYYLSAVGIADRDATLPAQCSAPSFPPTFTPTPTDEPPTPTPGPTSTPTATPTGDWTPTHTPTTNPSSTPWPTAVGGTITPLPTSTPNLPREITPEPSSTAFLPVKMPTANFGNIEAPSVPGYSTPEPFDVGVTPNATTESQMIVVGEWISQTEVTFNGWLTSTNTAMGWLNPNITSTTGISTPVQIADGMAANITAPVSYVRALGLYVPHLWPYILAIFLMVIWIFANLLIKFGLALIAEALELLRKVIELIPGF